MRWTKYFFQIICKQLEWKGFNFCITTLPLPDLSNEAIFLHPSPWYFNLGPAFPYYSSLSYFHSINFTQAPFKCRRCPSPIFVSPHLGFPCSSRLPLPTVCFWSPRYHQMKSTHSFRAHVTTNQTYLCHDFFNVFFPLVGRFLWQWLHLFFPMLSLWEGYYLCISLLLSNCTRWINFFVCFSMPTRLRTSWYQMHLFFISVSIFVHLQSCLCSYNFLVTSASCPVGLIWFDLQGQWLSATASTNMWGLCM